MLSSSSDTSLWVSTGTAACVSSRWATASGAKCSTVPSHAGRPWASVWPVGRSTAASITSSVPWWSWKSLTVSRVDHRCRPWLIPSTLHAGLPRFSSARPTAGDRAYAAKPA